MAICRLSNRYKAGRRIEAAARGLLARRLLARLKYNMRVAAATKWLAHLFEEVVPKVAPVVLAGRAAMASRIQTTVRRWIMWRRVLHRRFLNARATDIQRAYAGLRGRRLFKYLLKRQQFSLHNLFRRCESVGEVLAKYRHRTKWLYNPSDPMEGEGLGRYLRRFGAVHCVDALAQAGIVTVPSLRRISSVEALRGVGIEDERTARAMLRVHGHATPAADDATHQDRDVDIRDATVAQVRELFRAQFPEAGEALEANFVAAGTATGSVVSVYCLRRLLETATRRGAKDALALVVRWWEGPPLPEGAAPPATTNEKKKKPNVGSKEFDAELNRRRVRRFAQLTEMAIWRIIEVNAGALVGSCGSTAARYDSLQAEGGGSSLRAIVSQADAASRLLESAVDETAKSTAALMGEGGEEDQHQQQGKHRGGRVARGLSPLPKRKHTRLGSQLLLKKKDAKARAASARSRMALAKALASANAEKREALAIRAAGRMAELLRPALDADASARQIQRVYRGVVSRRVTDKLLVEYRERLRLEHEERERIAAEEAAAAAEAERQRVEHVKQCVQRLMHVDGATQCNPLRLVVRLSVVRACVRACVCVCMCVCVCVCVCVRPLTRPEIQVPGHDLWFGMGRTVRRVRRHLLLSSGDRCVASWRQSANLHGGAVRHGPARAAAVARFAVSTARCTASLAAGAGRSARRATTPVRSDGATARSLVPLGHADRRWKRLRSTTPARSSRRSTANWD